MRIHQEKQPTIYLLSFLITLANLFSIPFITTAGTYQNTVIQVIDGDTVIVSMDNRNITKHLSDIDATELGQAFGVEAKNKLEQMLLNKTVQVRPSRSLPGNMAEILFISGYMKNASEEMVRNGLAWSTTQKYKHHENFARKNRLGLWSEDNPTPPEDYRKALAKMVKQAELQKKQAKEKAERKTRAEIEETGRKITAAIESHESGRRAAEEEKEEEKMAIELAAFAAFEKCRKIYNELCLADCSINKYQSDRNCYDACLRSNCSDVAREIEKHEQQQKLKEKIARPAEEGRRAALRAKLEEVAKQPLEQARHYLEKSRLTEEVLDPTNPSYNREICWANYIPPCSEGCRDPKMSDAMAQMPSIRREEILLECSQDCADTMCPVY